MAKRLSQDLEQKIIELYPHSRSVYELARMAQVGKTTARRVLVRNGISQRRYFTRRLTETQELSLIDQYKNGSSMSTLQRDFGISRSVIIRALRRRNIESRNRGNSFKRLDALVTSDIIQRWKDGETQTSIALYHGITQQAVRAEVLRAGFEPKPRNHRKGTQSQGWKGGRTQDIHGYWRVYLRADSPFISMRSHMGYVAEHRLVMAEHIGRPLEWYESVHHINGKKDDNRIENLQLRLGPHGRGAAFQCADCGSCNVIPVKIAESA